MTNITISNLNNKYKITMTGHADYDVKGKDIVCAAISVIEFMLVSYAKMNPDKVITDRYIEENGHIELELTVIDSGFNVATDMVEIGLIALSEKYPENIFLKFDN